ncbi:MAG: NADH-quinone oxidoreductase subunit A [Myxococcales bacterium]|nr:NADH-quinone oxidoreductase subunit A [Myxococcales bacterium]
MPEHWAAALVFVGLSFVVGASMLLAARILRVRSRHASRLKLTTYECGEEPDGPAWIRFHPRYYLVALIFVLFDVEAVFLFPWALNIRALGEVALVDMFLFVGILLLGWLYALRKGALRWQ